MKPEDPIDEVSIDEMPPSGISITVTPEESDQFSKDFKKAKRKAKEMLTAHRVLWMATHATG